jgi:hypothetical protein
MGSGARQRLWRRGQKLIHKTLLSTMFITLDVSFGDLGFLSLFFTGLCCLLCEGNKRLDEWVTEDRLDASKAESVAERKAKKKKKTGAVKASGKKRSADEAATTTPHFVEHEKEHEEVTKVRNIQKIELVRKPWQHINNTLTD